jgi:hypothetical protein
MKTRLTLAFVFLACALFGAIPPPYQPNPWSTNVAGTTVQGGANIAIRSATVFLNTNEFALTNGRAGIGTNDPQAKLHVIGDGSTTNLLSLGTTATNNLANVDTNGGIHAYRAFRRDTNDVFEDQELITERRLQHVIQSLEGQTQFLTTNAHPVIAGARMASLDEVTSQWMTNTLGAGSNFIADIFATNYVSSGVISAGSYDLHLHMEYSQAGLPVVQVGFHLIRTNGAGTVIFEPGETLVLITQTENSYLLEAHVQAPLLVSPTDYVGVRIYATP